MHLSLFCHNHILNLTWVMELFIVHGHFHKMSEWSLSLHLFVFPVLYSSDH